MNVLPFVFQQGIRGGNSLGKLDQITLSKALPGNQMSELQLRKNRNAQTHSTSEKTDLHILAAGKGIAATIGHLDARFGGVLSVRVRDPPANALPGTHGH